MTNKAAIPNPALRAFSGFVGEWATTGTHPLMPGSTLHGKTSIQWLEGGAFLIMRSTIDHEKFPDNVSVFGSDDSPGTYFMLYYDEREVSRKSDASIENKTFTWLRDAPGFSQRYTFTLSEDGNSIISKGELSKDDKTWERDLDLVYTRIR